MLVESRFSKKSSFDLMIELAWDRIHEAKFSGPSVFVTIYQKDIIIALCMSIGLDLIYSDLRPPV